MHRLKFVTGISGPELLHAGLTYRLANISQLGMSAGLGPSFGSMWPTINFEHRLYIGSDLDNAGWKTWFFRQGVTYFPSAKSSQQFALTLTGGKDIPFRKNHNNGITIDAGVFYLPDSERSSIILVRSLNLWPALRFQFYFTL